MRLLIIGYFTLFFSLASFSSEAEQFYQEGLSAYQKQEYQKSKENFLKALEITPENKNLLFDLGLSSLKLNNKGAAIGYWRRALYYSPSYKPAKDALSYLIGGKLFYSSQDIGPWETFRRGFLIHYHLDNFLALTAALLLSSGWLLLRYFGKRKDAFLDDQPLPAFPTLGFLFTLSFLFFAVVTGLKLVDLAQPRATVIVESVAVKTAPDKESNTLFELLEGYEVIIENTKNGWTQITYPGGMTGWVLKDSLLQTYGRE